MKLVKINNPVGRSQRHQSVGVKLKKDNPPCLPTPSRAALAIAGSNNADLPSGVSTGD